jgi:hypothetical protein
MAATTPQMTTIGHNELTTYGARTIAITVVFTALATFAVIGRFWARYLNAFKPVIEDWLVVGALIMTWGYAAGNIVCKFSMFVPES